MDGSTDCSVIEKELIYVCFVYADGSVCAKLIVLKDVQHADKIAKKLSQELASQFGDVLSD